MSNAQQRGDVADAAAAELPDAPDTEVPATTEGEDGPANGSAEAPGEASVEQLTARLAEADRRAQAAEERALRLQAEMDNLRKRTEREVENAHKFGNEKLLGELLPAIDSMELGLDAAQSESADVAGVREGMELTLKMLLGAVTKFGAEVLDPAGEAFNPDIHQAIATQESPGTGANSVLQVVQKGYRLNGRLVRPALVIVAR